MDKGACRTSRKRNGRSKGERSSKKQEHRGVLYKNTQSVVMSEEKVQSVKWWQREWTETTKGAITKALFQKIVTGHGNIKAYLHKYKIIDDQTCPCRKGPQTVQHIILDCPLLEKEREKLKQE